MVNLPPFLVNLSTKALNIQEYYTLCVHSSLTTPSLSLKYKVISMPKTTHLVFDLHYCYRYLW